MSATVIQGPKYLIEIGRVKIPSNYGGGNE